MFLYVLTKGTAEFGIGMYRIVFFIGIIQSSESQDNN